ncbi:hypothetical protein PYCCODRAFT_1469536 [Trametes coccinea BRFM310]|uniref:Uncharacterized protein n=1 Tax=Trametes coccinea (strain BRFM310) TaxID=1353009 RepID=A0A1Y2IGC6_TRAC3|nr:hypothetical protein PYCCODRAFT_1469536 [Trametes coccinea BRFM310]
MHTRAIQTITLLLAASFTLVTASPAPIDTIQANVIAENRNMACSGPQGCVGANSTVADASSTSGAEQLLSDIPYNAALSIAVVGGLSVIAGVL